MKKIDKALAEVRAWKRKVGERTKNLTPKETVTYFRAARKRALKHRRAA